VGTDISILGNKNYVVDGEKLSITEAISKEARVDGRRIRSPEVSPV
jgi:hypothetical protein